MNWLTDEMQHLDRIDEIVDLPHESLHKDDFRKTYAHAAQLCRESLQFVEVVQLHGR